MSPTPGTLEYFRQQQVLAGSAALDLARSIATLRFNVLPHLLHGRVVLQARFVGPRDLHLTGHQQQNKKTLCAPVHIATGGIPHYGHRFT